MFGKKKEIRNLEGRIQELQNQNHKAMETMNMMSDHIQELKIKKDYGTYGQNQYTSREQQVNALLNKFAGEAEYGCELVQRLTLIRSAFALPVGVEIEAVNQSDDAEAEIDFAEKMLEANNLSRKNVIKTAVERELQGTVAFVLSWDDRGVEEDDIGTVKLNYLPWNEYSYEIKPAGKNNLSKPYKLVYESEKETPEVINEDNFVFSAINNRLGELLGRPLLGNIIHILEKLSMDLEAWRSRNKQFGKPTPHFKCETLEQVKSVTEQIENIGWKAGNAIATTGDFKFVEPSSQTPFEASIKNYIKIISAVTNVHPQFIGFPDLLSNRSTSESMGESTEVISQAEVTEWNEFYTDLIRKGIKMRNEKATDAKKLNPDAVKAVCGGFSDRQWKRIKDIWLPILKEGALSIETFLSKLPDINIEEEKERLSQGETNPLSPGSGFSGGKEPYEL